MAPPHFLTLPREVRDMIYQYYLYEPDGYHYDYKQNKFRTSSGARINLSLKCVCRQTCFEMRYTALTLNVLNFSPPVADEEMSHKAEEFSSLLEKIESAKEHAIKALTFPRFSIYRTSSVDNVLDCMYPDLKGLLEIDYKKPVYNCCREYCRLENEIRDSLGEAPSLLRSYTDTMVHALSKNPDFVRALAEWAPPGPEVIGPFIPGPRPRRHCLPESARDDQRVWSFLNHNPHFLLTFDPDSQFSAIREPWSIPSHFNLHYLSAFPSGRRILQRQGSHETRFSAAAAAITYLKALKQEKRLAVRRIVLHETCTTRAHPECHGLGLIPFCRENLCLTVSRRVSFWRTALYPVRMSLFQHLRLVDRVTGFPNELFCGMIEEEIRERTPGQTGDYWGEFGSAFRSKEAVDHFAGWIIEASRLSAAGMPDGSFTLLFDADVASDQASRFFELLKLQVAWQQAWDHWTATRPMHRSFRTRRTHSTFMYEGLPQVVEDMIQGRSPIKCNFPIGEPVDINAVIDDIPTDEAWEHIREERRWIDGIED